MRDQTKNQGFWQRPMFAINGIGAAWRVSALSSSGFCCLEPICDAAYRSEKLANSTGEACDSVLAPASMRDSARRKHVSIGDRIRALEVRIVQDRRHW